MSQYARNVHTALVGMITRTDGLVVEFTGRQIDYGGDVILEYEAQRAGITWMGWASIEDGEAFIYDPWEEIITDGNITEGDV